MRRSLKELLQGLVDRLDTIVYALLFLIGFGAIAFVAYVAIVG
jgi:hypothetical protein